MLPIYILWSFSGKSETVHFRWIFQKDNRSVIYPHTYRTSIDAKIRNQIPKPTQTTYALKFWHRKKPPAEPVVYPLQSSVLSPHDETLIKQPSIQDIYWVPAETNLPSPFLTNLGQSQNNTELNDEAENDDDEKKNKKRRRLSSICGCSPCCCCLLAILIAVLLGALVAAIVFLNILSTNMKNDKTSIQGMNTTSTTQTTSTTTTSNTTTGCTSCSNFCWNQTSSAVAGTASTKFANQRCIEFDANDNMYIGGHDISYVYKSTPPYTTRTTATTSFNDHLDYLIFGKNGDMYTNDHKNLRVRRYSSGSTTGTIIASSFNNPVGLAIDPSLNLYIGDQGAKEVILMNPAGATLTSVIDTSGVISKQSALLFPKNSYDRLYISDEGGDGVYLWRINASTFDQKLTNVVGGVNLKEPRGMRLDPFGNLYVADTKNERIMMFCVNATIGNVVATLNDAPLDVAFDSQMNLYAVTDGDDVVKFNLL